MNALDKRQVRRAFCRWAKADTPADIIAERLWERVGDMAQTPTRIADIGGNGDFITDCYPTAHIAAIDFALPVLRQATKTTAHRILADAEALPFADATFDMLWSNLCLEWTNHTLFFTEAARVLKVNGLFAFTTLGPDTLTELRQVFPNEPRIHAFPDMHDISDALIVNGFTEPLTESDRLTFTYPTANAAMVDCRNMGAGNALVARPRRFMGKTRWQQACHDYATRFTDDNQRAFATAEVILITAWRRDKAVESTIHFHR